MVSQNPHPYDVTPDKRVATLLAAAAAPAEAGPQPGEEQVLAAFRAAPHRTRRIAMTSLPSPAHRAKLAVAATIGAGTFLFAGVGAAAAGVLPDAAQDTASTVLGQLGFEVPRANDAAGDHPTQRGAEEDAEATETDADVDATETEDTGTDATETETDQVEGESAQGKGADVSELATTTDAEGVDKGAEISTYASGGKSRAGAEHTAPEPATGDDAATGAGDDAADDAADDADAGAAEDNDGASASGTDTADEASSGRLAAGSGHRP